MEATADNTAYTLRAIALALRNIAPFGRNVVYAGNVVRNCQLSFKEVFAMSKILSTAFGVTLAFALLFASIACGQESKPQVDQSKAVVSAIERGEWRRALEVAKEWTQREPKSAIAAYVVDLAVDVLDDASTPALTQYDFPYSDKRAMSDLESWAKSLLKRDPKNPNLLVLNAMLYSPKAFADVNQCVRLLEKAVVAAPKNAFVLEGLGSAYGAQGQFDLAIETLEKAIALNPKSSGAYTNLGVAFLKKRDASKAEQALKKAVEVNELDPMAWFNLGSFYAERGRTREAKPALEKAIELMPKLLEARWNLGGIYYNSGQRSKAIEQLRKIIEIASDSPMGQRAKQMLRSLGE